MTKFYSQGNKCFLEATPNLYTRQKNLYTKFVKTKKDNDVDVIAYFVHWEVFCVGVSKWLCLT